MKYLISILLMAALIYPNYSVAQHDHHIKENVCSNSQPESQVNAENYAIMKYNEEEYTQDILGEGFEQLTLRFEDDFEGEVIATLIRSESVMVSSKAILYIHGFNDYFFQKEMAQRFNQEGFHFYALDLRKYGRSYLPHQKLNNLRSLEEYDEEINAALHIIQAEQKTEVILMGHSTGGLIVTNYAGRHLNSDLFKGMICNSPFYEFNLHGVERKIGISLLSFTSRLFPNILISGGFSKLYGYSLHKDKYGEWDYALDWKPHDIPKVNLSFIHAIRKAHQFIQKDLTLNIPTLVMHSHQTIEDKNWSEKFHDGDAVLNVKHIEDYAKKINGEVTIVEIKEGMHDLVLSKIEVRTKVYQVMFDWIDSYSE